MCLYSRLMLVVVVANKLIACGFQYRLSAFAEVGRMILTENPSVMF